MRDQIDQGAFAHSAEIDPPRPTRDDRLIAPIHIAIAVRTVRRLFRNVGW
jgi:hypothetical protein